MIRERGPSIRSKLGTEFGTALEAMLTTTPGGLAGVVSDDEGEAIDYAHDPERLDELDVQLLGAQLGRPLSRLHDTSRAQGLHDPVLIFETRARIVVASTVLDAFVMVMLLDRRANLGLALPAFEAGRDTLRPLLAG